MLGGAGSGLRNGSPGEAGLTERGVAAIGAAASAGLTEATAETGRPYYPGYVVLAGCGDVVALHEAGGDVLRYADREGTELAAGQRIATRPDTVFDIASISKLITSIAVMQQVQDGALELDRPVASYLPAFGAAGKGSITLRRLLTHTSGLPADPDPALWTYPTATDRVAAVHSTVPVAAPGAAYCYSDINLMALALLVQHACGATLDAVVGDRITGPLAMADTGYRPAAPPERIAPTEYEHDPDRGLVWGEVHDENAWSLDGVAGHAGVFSTAWDLAVLARTILGGGSYGGARILRRDTVAAMLHDENPDFPGAAHGLGFELDQPWYMGDLASPSTAGHTGFTGTSMVLDTRSGAFVVLLSNRVHPSRGWGKINPIRQRVASALAGAIVG